MPSSCSPSHTASRTQALVSHASRRAFIRRPARICSLHCFLALLLLIGIHMYLVIRIGSGRGPELLDAPPLARPTDPASPAQPLNPELARWPATDA